MNANSSPPDATRPSAHWENYWAGSADDGRDAAVTGASRSEAFQSTWRLFFENLTQECETANGVRLADLACGAGVISDIAKKTLPPECLKQSRFLGLDYSLSAARQYGARFRIAAIGSASGIHGDALNVPIKPRSIDAVTSQFGLEYAGPEAVAGAGTLVAPGGRIMCLVHCKNGGIEVECRENLVAAEVILSSKALLKTQAHFADPNNAIALLEMRAAMDKLRKAMDSLTESAGKRLLGKLRLDLTRLIARRAAFDPREVAAWFDANNAEVSLYADRMRSMTHAALDEATVNHVLGEWTADGLKAAAPEAVIIDGATRPSAWRLFAKRPRD